jgi:phosphohistidine phosphatase SixA
MGDHNTPLAHNGVQAKKVGENLKNELELPDVIFVSPYLRTKETLKQLMEGWPELKNVKS